MINYMRSFKATNYMPPLPYDASPFQSPFPAYDQFPMLSMYIQNFNIQDM